ncbi:hypothetical protein AB1Y20_022323 [Prymnesium parvum]|uniref:RNase NYN domain-containing protein n=1 Tax=Prymnesium parvum TaxID=97485 RepID=A0AB34JI25_PRYPA
MHSDEEALGRWSQEEDDLRLARQLQAQEEAHRMRMQADEDVRWHHPQEEEDLRLAYQLQAQEEAGSMRADEGMQEYDPQEEDDLRLAYQLQAQEEAVTMQAQEEERGHDPREDEDLRLAYQLQAQEEAVTMQGQEERGHDPQEDEDLRLAYQLQAQEEAVTMQAQEEERRHDPQEDEDLRLAYQLQAQEEAQGVADEELALKLQAAEQEQADLAYSQQLQQMLEADQKREKRSRPTSNPKHADEARAIQRVLYQEAGPGQAGASRRPQATPATAMNYANAALRHRPYTAASVPAADCGSRERGRPPGNALPVLPHPRPPQGRVLIVIDGANVGFTYGNENGRPGVFCARGVWLCFEFWRRQGVQEEHIAVTLNENRWDPNDQELAALGRFGALNWAPSGVDDDLFTINLAQSQGAFIVTKDTFRNYQMHVSSELRRRLIKFWFAGSGSCKEIFGVSEADCARVCLEATRQR